MLTTLSNEAKILILIGIVSVAILIGAVFVLSKPIENKQTKVVASDKKNLLVKSDSHKTATSSAEVTLVEFADFQCPACGSAHPILKQLKLDYKDRVNFVFRNFPLPQHKNALPAALAAEAAGEQSKFWEYHDMLYENQAVWENEANPEEIFLKYAKDLKLDEAKFKKVYESKKYESKISEDVADGTSLGVNSTPTFFLNDKIYPGVLGLDQFKSLIDKALK